MSNAAPLEITPRAVKNALDLGEKLFLVDVREPEELRLAALDNAEHIPMRTVPANLQQLEGMSDEAPVIIFCHHGMRSLQVAQWLRERGIENCQSMSGGIDQWSVEIDARVPRY